MAEGIELKMFMGPVHEMLIDNVLTVTKAEAMFQEKYNSNEIIRVHEVQEHHREVRGEVRHGENDNQGTG